MNREIINATIATEINKVSEVATYLWERGWAERNGGNISLNLTDLMDCTPKDTSESRYIKVNSFPKELAEKIFFISGTGERLRELSSPEQTACIIQFDKEVNGYFIIWGGDKPGFRPTSELISHMKIHLSMEKTNNGHRAVIHTHPTEMICMSHHPIYSQNEETFNNAIWSMLPEVRAFVPRGVALTPYAIPGSEKLADLTVEALKNRDVVLWMKHGALAAGRDISEAFDFIDVANKGCQIFLKCLASGFTPIGMTKEEMQELVEVFNL
jgi:rhamnulose-1-phosphate aldolase